MIRAIFCLAIFAFLGCTSGNDADALQGVPVTGTVKLDGKPLVRAVIMFIPTTTGQGAESTAVTDEHGHYELKMGTRDTGPMPGEHQVVINKFVLPDGSDIPADSTAAPIDINAHELLPPIYSDAQATQLKETVPQTGGVINFDLKSPVKK